MTLVPEDPFTMFAQAVVLEADPATHQDAESIYRALIARHPSYAAIAAVNLGTLFFARKVYIAAEKWYRHATLLDPEYALAWFDLGTVLCDLERREEAVEAYNKAVGIAPDYADAHYNLALILEVLKRPRRAVVHWTAYAKRGHDGPALRHARGRIKELLRSERLRVVRKESQ